MTDCSRSCSLSRKNARPVRRSCLTNVATSFATGKGSGRASPERTRRAVTRYDANCEVDQTLGFEGKSSTLTGEGKGGFGEDGNVSALTRCENGCSSAATFFDGFIGDSNDGGIGNGLGDERAGVMRSDFE